MYSSKDAYPVVKAVNRGDKAPSNHRVVPQREHSIRGRECIADLREAVTIMNHPNDDFMNYMGFRNMLLEDKIEECLVASRRGKPSVSINRGDLSDEEIRYLKKRSEED